jgi:cytochrome P450
VTVTSAPPARTRRTPPGPPRTATPSLLRRMLRDRLEVMDSAVAEYGDAVRLPLGPKILYVFNHPDHAKHVLADNPENYHKGIGMIHARRVMGDGLLTSQGELWRKQRKAVQPVFQAKRIAQQLDSIVAAAQNLVSSLRSRVGAGPVDMREEMTGLTLDVLGRTLVAADLGEFDTMGHSFEAVQDQAIFEMMSLNAVPIWAPLPRQRRFHKARKDLQDIVDKLAAQRIANPSADGADIISRLIESTGQETDPRVARTRMRDELVTLLLAGHETTASTLSWSFYLIDKHPEVWERLHEEAVEAFSGDEPLTYKDLYRFPYTTMVIEEVMRLYPPVWILPRLAQQEDEIGGYYVPAGADVLVCPYLLHRHPGFWPDPTRFDPERFAPDKSAGRNRYSYIPFGAGPRFCVGNSLGMMEATIVLAAVARELRLKKVPGYQVVGEPMLTLRVRGGLPMTVHAA